MKKYLQDLIAKRNAEIANLEARNETADNVDELRSIGTQLEAKKTELRDAQDMLAEIEKKEEEQRKGNPFGGHENRNQDADDMEYRLAFKDWIQKGTPIPAELRKSHEFRQTGATVTSDIPVLIPKVVMNKIVHKKDNGVYGQIYNRIRKTSLPYGLQFPITDLNVQGAWVAEGATISEQKAGDAKEYVSFFGHVWSGKVARSLLVSIMALDAFEDEVAYRIREAFLLAMDTAIVKGTGSGQPLGILKDPRVTNVVKFKAKEISDWKAWNKVLWSQIPVRKRNNGVLIVGQSTFGQYIQSMADGNNRPLFKELGGEYDGAIHGRFMGHEVIVVEDDLLGSYDTIGNNAEFAIYLPLDDYAVNSPLDFGLRQYEDNNNHNTIVEGLVVADGKALETVGIYKIQKDTAPEAA